MDGISETLNEELSVKTVFTIPIGKGIAVNEATVVTWIIMAFLILFCFLMTRGLKVHNISKRQAFIEWVYEKLTGMVGDMVGPEGKSFVPYLTTVLLYIGLANIIGVFGFKSPTKDLNVTAALAIMSILLVEAAGIRRKGVKKWAHTFAEPVAIVAPIKVLELFTRPLSLCMRLFGNVLGAFVIMKLIECVVPAVLPSVFSLYFDFFDGLLQAYVFVFLTSLYISEAIE